MAYLGQRAPRNTDKTAEQTVVGQPPEQPADRGAVPVAGTSTERGATPVAGNPVDQSLLRSIALQQTTPQGAAPGGGAPPPPAAPFESGGRAATPPSTGSPNAGAAPGDRTAPTPGQTEPESAWASVMDQYNQNQSTTQQGWGELQDKYATDAAGTQQGWQDLSNEWKGFKDDPNASDLAADQMWKDMQTQWAESGKNMDALTNADLSSGLRRAGEINAGMGRSVGGGGFGAGMAQAYIGANQNRMQREMERGEKFASLQQGRMSDLNRRGESQHNRDLNRQQFGSELGQAGLNAQTQSQQFGANLGQAGLDAQSQERMQGLELQMTHLQDLMKQAEASKDRQAQKDIQDSINEVMYNMKLVEMGQIPGGGAGPTDNNATGGLVSGDLATPEGQAQAMEVFRTSSEHERVNQAKEAWPSAPATLQASVTQYGEEEDRLRAMEWAYAQYLQTGQWPEDASHYAFADGNEALAQAYREGLRTFDPMNAEYDESGTF